MIREKIHLIESEKEGFDEIPLDEVREMIGYYEPEEQQDKPPKWEVTMMEEGTFFSAKDQDSAEIISGNEMIKAMLMRIKR